MEIRTLADWTIRRRLLAIGGVSEVYAMGGERKQFQVLLRTDDLRKYDVWIEDVEAALNRSNQNVTGGYLSGSGPALKPKTNPTSSSKKRPWLLW